MLGIVEKIIDIGGKFIPDKNAKMEFEKEMRALDTAHLKEKGNYVEKINQAIPWVIPAYLLVLLFMFFVNYLLDVGYTLLQLQAPIIHIDNHLVNICLTIIGFLFSKKTLTKFAKK